MGEDHAVRAGRGGASLRRAGDAAAEQRLGRERRGGVYRQRGPLRGREAGNARGRAAGRAAFLRRDEGCSDAQGIKSELLYIGFWTDKGNADSDTLDFLSKLKNKKIFLFGTAGFGGSDAYFQKILGNVKSAIDSSNTIVGEYMCQGKMPQSVRERYVKMKENPEHPDNIDALIENFDKALSHPDSDDLERLKNIII